PARQRPAHGSDPTPAGLPPPAGRLLPAAPAAPPGETRPGPVSAARRPPRGRGLPARPADRHTTAGTRYARALPTATRQAAPRCGRNAVHPGQCRRPDAAAGPARPGPPAENEPRRTR